MSLPSLANSGNYEGALKGRATFPMGCLLATGKSVAEVVCGDQQAFSSGEREVFQVDLRLAWSPWVASKRLQGATKNLHPQAAAVLPSPIFPLPIRLPPSIELRQGALPLDSPDPELGHCSVCRCC